MKAIAYLYNNASESGSAIADKLGLKKIKHEGSTFQGGPDWTVLNWGSGSLPKSVKRSRVINKEEAVLKSVNKRVFFEWVKDHARVPDFTQDWYTAREWALEGSNLIVRSRLEAAEGVGATFVNASVASNLGLLDPIVQKAKLFTRYMEPVNEYRVHVVGGKAIAVHRKVDGDDPTIKNTANGWKFKKVTVYNQDLEVQALKAVSRIGLDFAAVDLIWDGHRAWVLETNTAPGIYELTATLNLYVEALKGLIESE